METIGRRAFVAMSGTAALAALRGGFATPALAQAKWPERPVRLIVPLAPGGAIDFVARQCGEVMTRTLGQQVIVENRTGAGGTIGTDAVMRADPDGYTILVTNDNAASAPHVLKLPQDYTRVLLPVCDIGHQPLVLGVHPSLGVGSVGERLAVDWPMILIWPA